MKVWKIILVMLTFFLTNISFGQKINFECSRFNSSDSCYWLSYIEFNPYSFLNYKSFPMEVRKTNSTCLDIVEYLNHTASEPPYDSFKIIFNHCNPDSSKYEFEQHYSDLGFPDILKFSARLEFVDSLTFSFKKKEYTIKKYKAEVLEGEFITLYYSDTFGIIKQYGSYRSISNDNIEIRSRIADCTDCHEKDLANEFIKAIWENDHFHERYDYGPRTIRMKILNKRCFRKTKRRYKRKGYL